MLHPGHLNIVALVRINIKEVIDGMCVMWINERNTLRVSGQWALLLRRMQPDEYV
jgi:hypothetical protein